MYRVAGLVVLLLSLIACQARANEPQFITRTTATSCEPQPVGLTAAPFPKERLDASLEYSGTFQREISRVHATALTGGCAPLVQSASMGIVKLSTGDFYRLEPHGITRWIPPRPTMFDPARLSDAELPDLPGGKFIRAVLIDSRQGQNQMARRFVGIWKESDAWLLADFIVPGEGKKSPRARTLLRSLLPLRSVSSFPSPDTNSGALSVVQEGQSGEIILIRFDWSHGAFEAT